MKTIKKQIVTLLTGFALFSGTVYPQNQNCLHFDGFDDYVQVIENNNLLFTPMTGEAWIKLDNIPSPASLMGTVFAKYDNSTNSIVDYGGYLLYVSTTGLPGVVIMSNTLNINTGIIGSMPLSTNTWYHLAFTYTNAALKLYVDGNLVQTFPNPVVMGNTSNPLEIGRISNKPQPSYPYSYFPGNIDEVRIWNTELTESQIRENMHREVPDPSLLANLKAYYQFNESSGTVLPDISSSSFNGTLNNMNPLSDWVASTAPIPYFTTENGVWYSDATWGDQKTPLNSWARVNIKHQIGNYGFLWDTEVIDLVIDPGASLTIAPGINLTVTGYLECISPSGLILKSYPYGSASLLYPGLGVSGTVETTITQNKWHFISTPVAGIESGVFTGEYLQMHNEQTNLYSDIIPTNYYLNVMRGFALWTFQDKTFSYEGILNSSPFTIPVTRFGLGWNLVGNPYPSSIDWDAPSGWNKYDVDNAIYIENNGGWATYIAGIGTNGGTRYIAPGQGFFVNCNTYIGMLGVDDNARVHYPTTFFKSAVTDFIKLSVTGNDHSDEAVIRFVDEATVDFDGQWDAHKLPSMENLPEIYSVASEKQLSINALPPTETIQLGFRGQSGSYYTLQAVEISEIPVTILEDKVTGVFTDLTATNYTFQHQPIVEDRFVIHFTPMSINTPESVKNPIRILGNVVDVDIEQGETAFVSVFNLLGQEVVSAKFNHENRSIVLNHPGTYVIRMIINENSFATKAIIQ